jgi:integrase
MKDALAAIATAQTTGKRQIVRDGRIRGLALIAMPTGNATWRFEYRPRGMDPATGRRFGTRHQSIGNIATHSPDAARAAAAAIKTKAIAGEDPAVQVREQRRQDDIGQVTLGEALELYEQTRLVNHRSKRDIVGAIRHVFSSLLKRPLPSITTAMVAKAISSCVERGATVRANRALAYIKPLFKWAVEQGFISANPAQGISKPTIERPRERVLTIGELRSVLSVADADDYPFRQIFRALLFTATRRGEVADLRADELDLDDRCWTIPASRSKNGRAIRVPLTGPALAAIVEGLTARQGQAEHVFTTTGRTAASGFSKFKQRLDRESGVKDWRFHDIRTAFATHCAGAGISPEVVDRCLNHVGSSTMGVVARAYMQHDLYDQRKAALEYWAAAVLETVP